MSKRPPTNIVGFLPKVDKVLVIGWPWAENRCLHDFAQQAGRKVEITVMSSSERSAGEVKPESTEE